MISLLKASLTCSLLLVAAVACGDEPPAFPGTAPEHELLQRFVGEWEITGECTIGPGSEPTKNTGRTSSRLLGERWAINEMVFDTDGIEIRGVQTLGYDPAKQKYVGTWTDSMMNHLWVYEGVYDEEKRTLTLDTMGPNMMGDGELIPYQDTFEFVSKDKIVMRSQAKDDAGEWVVFMTSEMSRVAE
ncbi:hypothetical protein MalM25_01980 [Planctomycetes bacterium MalM25]|nr:hypothetical protein MalM25_01980 [Planctomycetes bacterium MalM25]